MDMTDLDLPALRGTAEAVIGELPNGWIADVDGIVLHPDKDGNSWDGYIVCEVPDGSWADRETVKEYIAAFDPPTVLALLNRLEQEEKDADAVAVHATNLTLDNSTLRRDNARLADQRDLMRVSVDKWRGRAIVAETKIARVTGAPYERRMPIIEIVRRAVHAVVSSPEEQGFLLDAESADRTAANRTDGRLAPAVDPEHHAERYSPDVLPDRTIGASDD